MVYSWDELSALDRPDILQFVFYPRKDFSEKPAVPNADVCSISVDEGVSISCRFYFGDEKTGGDELSGCITITP